MIEEVGVITGLRRNRGDIELRLNPVIVLEDMKLGASLALDGVCLTVEEMSPEGIKVTASKHTAMSTTIQHWRVGKKVNLERAMLVGGRLGGHLVQGHIDGIAKVVKIQYESGATFIHFSLAEDMMPLLAPKGSITIQGVSLTLANKANRGFKVMVVPFTLDNTTLGELKPGDNVNIETDIIIRWLADRFQDKREDESAFPDWLPSGRIHLED